jgi:hypothetical protein
MGGTMAKGVPKLSEKNLFKNAKLGAETTIQLASLFVTARAVRCLK